MTMLTISTPIKDMKRYNSDNQNLDEKMQNNNNSERRKKKRKVDKGNGNDKNGNDIKNNKDRHNSL